MPVRQNLTLQTLYDWPRLHPVRRAVAALSGWYYWNDVREAVARSRWKERARALGGCPIPEECQRSRILFIHIPRCAGMSISARLYGNIRDHLTASYFARIDPDFFSKAFTFAVMRDPVARAISAFKYVLNKGASDMALDWGWQRKTRGIATLDDYIGFLERNYRRLHQLDYVMRPQVTFVCDEDGTPLVDELFRLEWDMAAVNAMFRRWGMPEVPHINTTPATNVAVDASQIARLRQLYAADVRLYEALGAAGDSLGCASARRD